MSYFYFKYHKKSAQQKCTVHTFKKFNKDTFCSCAYPDKEGCQCDLGYVLQNGACVEFESCGCTTTRYGYVQQGITQDFKTYMYIEILLLLIY